MSLRPRRALLGLITGAAALAGLPASALAAGETLSVAPSSTQAGSNPTITTNLGFAPTGSDTPKTAILSAAPGLLANLTANPSCTTGSPQLTGTTCQVGTATATFSLGGGPSQTAPGNVYLVPPQNPTDFAGFDTVITGFPAPQYTGASLRTTPAVGADLTTNFPSQPGVQITGFSLTLNPTFNGQPFTHLPTSCSAATSTLNVTYQGSTPAGSATSSFTPTGCSALPYAPKFTAAITKDKTGSGAALTLTQTQAIGESSSKTIVFTLPKGVTPNVPAVGPCLTGGSGCQIGTAVATSPGIPAAALAHGVVKLAGSITAPVLQVSFPAPFGLTVTGQVNLANSTVTFANVPDLPLTSLALMVTGPNGQKAFNTDCAPASIKGQFTAQSGTTATVNAPIKFTGCASKPAASGSTSGLASGHPNLKFTVTHGKGAANVATVALGLPRGLKFSRSAIVSKKSCTTKGQTRKCTTTTLIKGLLVSGANAKSVAIKGGKLVVALKKPAGKVTLTVSGPLVSESKGLQSSVKKHKTKSLKFTLKITDAKKHASTISKTLKAH